MLDPEDAQDLPEMLQLLNGLILDRLSLSLKSLPNSPVMLESERKITEVKSALARALISAQAKLEDRISYNNRLLQIAQINNFILFKQVGVWHQKALCRGKGYAVVAQKVWIGHNLAKIFKNNKPCLI